MIYSSLYQHFVDWLQTHMFTCPSVKYLHIECPGCGMQRGAVALLKGEFLSSLAFYPALIPLIFLVTYTVLHILFKFANGARIIVLLQAVVTSIVIGHYIYKIIHHQIIH